MPRANRPCLTCGTPSPGSYCPIHQRNSNLARDQLETIAQRDGWTCQLCHEPVTHRGRDAKAATLDHIDMNPQNDTEANLRLAHNACNVARQQAGWAV